MNRIRKIIITIIKSLTPQKAGVYYVCKSHVFKRNQLKEIPNKSILSVAKFKRPSGKDKKNEY